MNASSSPRHVRPIRPDRSIVLIGLMGAGKTSVGRRLASALNLPFMDADEEIERAAGRTVSEIFEDFGEAEFRDGERRVIARLLEEDGPIVLALGGGAFTSADTRQAVKARAISIWLQADIDTLMERVLRRDTRPLLRTEDPRQVMENLLETRTPAYSEAMIHIDASSSTHQATVQSILEALDALEAQE